jgi:hypothetical protein
MTTEIKNIGQFKVTSGALRVTDPCYSKDTWCAGTVKNVLNGTWEAEIVKTDDTQGWGDRVAVLRAYHESANLNKCIRVDSGINVGVDSGQAGIFDDSLYPDDPGGYNDDDSFYSKVCQLTYKETDNPERAPKVPPADCSPEKFVEYLKKIEKYHPFKTELTGGCINFGCASSSGYGDGGYECFIFQNEDKVVVGVEIIFISDEEELEDV